MKSLIEFLEEISETQLSQAKEQTLINKQISSNQSELAQKIEDLELQQSQVIVNQEYANCLLELNS